MEKVRKQDRITNIHLHSLLSKQGIDIDYVELVQDYAPRSKGKGYSPYAQFFRDRISGKRIMEVGGLPMVSVSGSRIVPRWRSKDRVFYSEENCFEARVISETVNIVCVNNQPNGIKKGEELTWHPQLYINGSMQQSGKPICLDTDSTNPNYHLNVIEWDYGFCRRQVRVIEGRIRERWIFDSNPNGEVRIKHNCVGAGLKLGRYKINGDEELVPASVFNEVKYPFEIGASATYYPDADVETSSVDGWQWQTYTEESGVSWGTIVTDAGAAGGSDSTVDIYAPYILADKTVADQWRALARGIMLFDTSALPDTATISAATLSLYGNTKSDALSITPDVAIYASAPASNTALVAGDYDSLGTTAFSAVIAYGDVSTVAYNDFALNAAGKTAIDKTGVSKFGARNANYDVAEELDPGNHAPAWTANVASYLLFYSADQGGTTNDPKLVVTYILPTNSYGFIIG